MTGMFTLVSLLTFAQKATDDLSGKWKTEEGQIILISKTGDVFNGVSENEKGTVLKDVKFTGGKWKGIIQKPNGNAKADCEIVLDGKNLRIVAKKSFFTKKMVWTKS
ncbi:hypothetical protein SAMN05660862_1002 [Sphingobacterium psychroaquaticum]|uniref:DUF2147 domain-containing protein n=2 Tax=Sphingobacterium psychroaquaticum TaxID=561061 RepID=A0A1X7ILM4_9SPHI|nr:hypothetical protein SAMN05660862_1002 [Sphingobacterium psychroaquaticum]